MGKTDLTLTRFRTVIAHPLTLQPHNTRDAEPPTLPGVPGGGRTTPSCDRPTTEQTRPGPKGNEGRHDVRKSRRGRVWGKVTNLRRNLPRAKFQGKPRLPTFADATSPRPGGKKLNPEILDTTGDFSGARHASGGTTLDSQRTHSLKGTPDPKKIREKKGSPKKLMPLVGPQTCLSSHLRQASVNIRQLSQRHCSLS